MMKSLCGPDISVRVRGCVQVSKELREVIQKEEGRDSSSHHALALSLGLRPPSLALGTWPASITGISHTNSTYT